MLWPDQRWPQDVGALAVIDGTRFLESDGRFRLEAAREGVLRRLHLLPRFRQVLVTPPRGLGWPLWVDDPGFDLRHHVDVAQVPVPGDEVQLLQTVERLRRRRLDPQRPLWEMWFLPGLRGSRVGLFIRLHHVVADGIAGVASLTRFLDDRPEAEPPTTPSWEPTPRPSNRDLLADNLRRRAARLADVLSSITRPVELIRGALAAWPSLREVLAQEPGPRTSLNRLVGTDRTFGLIREDLDVVKQVAHAHGATINDVLLTITAAGLQALLQGRREAADNLPIYVPVSLRSKRAPTPGGNLITQMVVRLPLGTADPVLRLREISAETARRKAVARPSLGTTFRGKLISALLLRRIAGQRVNVETADLPGPQQPLYLAGARLLEVFPLLNLIGNVSLGVGAISYAGQFNVMVIADGEGYPDLDEFTAAARKELRALADIPVRSHP
jgi:WS/DGAT/MGAT family acyltransferase